MISPVNTFCMIALIVKSRRLAASVSPIYGSIETSKSVCFLPILFSFLGNAKSISTPVSIKIPNDAPTVDTSPYLDKIFFVASTEML